MSGYFEGYYYKHQKDNNTLCIIVGKSNSEEFIQIITDEFSLQIPRTGKNHFTKKGIFLNIKTQEVSLSGKILYGPLSPIKYDIMGPFKYFPMECRHGIISMYHRLNGKVNLNGKELDFTNGFGYIEKDSGKFFPSSYAWIHANDFNTKCSIMVSVATIPFLGFHFKGCICVVHYNGQEYRLATYLGVKIISCTKNSIILTQGPYRLAINIHDNCGLNLIAPSNGAMTRTIVETASCHAKFHFYIKGRLLFSLKSNHTSFEYEM